MSQQIFLSPEKRALIGAQRHLDQMRDAEIDAWDEFASALKCPEHREQAVARLEQAKMHFDAATIGYADALLSYRAWWDSARTQLSLAAEAAKLTHLAS